jgi:hypothetical protein
LCPCVADHPNADAAGSKARWQSDITDRSVTRVRDLLRGRLAKDYGTIAAPELGSIRWTLWLECTKRADAGGGFLRSLRRSRRD